MAESPQVRTIRAAWVIPVAGPLIAGGCVVIQGEKILAVGTKPEGSIAEYPSGIILPGFVNAHTHLEFSDLAAPIAPPGTPLYEWIQVINRLRRERVRPPTDAIQQGLRESLSRGTTTLGEIETTGWTDVIEHGLRLVRFRELLGLTPQRIADCAIAAQEHLSSPGRVYEARALSPHAPYTVHPEFLKEIVSLAQQKAIPLAMHVAESREELELLATGQGPLRDLLEQAGVWVEEAFATARRPVNVLEVLAAAPRSLVVHGNYLTNGELSLLAQHADHMAVVYCPRTHAYFGHDPYPLQSMLSAGVRVTLGTDSRASNPDLGMLGEIQQVGSSHTGLSPTDVLRLATIEGATALGMDDRVGSIEPGKDADLVIIQGPEKIPRDPVNALLDPESSVIATYTRGLKAFG